MLRPFSPILMLTLVLVTTGCATIVAGGPSTLEAESDPSGAEVEAVGLENADSLTGTTPTTFTLDKGSDYELTFRMEGFESETVVVRREVNGWFFGNLLFGGIPGGIVDFATNNMWRHTLQVARVDFRSARSRPDGSFVADVVVRTVHPTEEPVTMRVPLRFHPTS